MLGENCQKKLLTDQSSQKFNAPFLVWGNFTSFWKCNKIRCYLSCLLLFYPVSNKMHYCCLRCSLQIWISDGLTCTSALYVTTDGNGMRLTRCEQLWVFIPCDCMFQFPCKISYNKNNYYKKLDHWIMQFKTFYWLSRYGIFNNYSMSARWIWGGK